MTTVHGGLDPLELQALGIRPEEVLDFSVSVNPLGPSPAALQAIRAADVSSYPDRHCLRLRDGLSGRTGLDREHILPGNGSTELIHLVARALLGPKDRCLIFGPTFGEYEAAARLAGADVHPFRAEEKDAFVWSIEEAGQAIAARRPRVVFLCNPNNPTGVYLDRADVERLISAVGKNGLLILDEAYAPLADRPWDALPLLAYGNVLLLRSMTKDHAMPGVRLGYLVGPPAVLDRIRRFQPPWSVSAIAEACGLAALEAEAEDHVARGKQVIQQAKAYLVQELNRIGLAAHPSAANFMLVKVGNGARIRRGLLGRRICVRDCASFGFPEYIRVGVRPIDDCRHLIAALEAEIR